MWSDPQFPWWPQFFQKQVFPSVPFLVYFNCAIISKFPPLFSVCWLGSANHIVCLQIFIFARRRIHPGNCSPAPSPVGFNRSTFLKASSLSSRVQILPLRALRIICFWNFSRHSTLKNSSCALLCLFQSLNYSWKHPPDSSSSYLVQVRPRQSVWGMSLRKNSYEAFVFSVFSRTQVSRLAMTHLKH